MSTLGHSLVSNNQILQSVGLANTPSANMADPYPQFSSIVGGVSGCSGAGGSAAALAGKAGDNTVAVRQHGGQNRPTQTLGPQWFSQTTLTTNPDQTVVTRYHGGKNGSHRCGGGNKRSGNKRGGNKRSGNKRSNKRGGNKRSVKRGGNNKRSMRGGLSALSPTPFSGAANAPYHQFMGNQPVSYVYGLGVDAPIPPSDSWMASPPSMNNIHNSCGTNNGLIPLIK